MTDQVRILCVDDELHVLRSLQRLFLDEDYEIITAPTGAEGLEVLSRTEPVQIVISDYRMPGMNGVEFLQAVCRKWPDTVRIVLSGYADTAAVVAAINDGQIYKFIPKPWNDDELRVTVANAVERYVLHLMTRNLTRELQQKNEELLTLNDTLEKTIAKRTAELVLQNKILTVSRSILEALPVGVIGIDPDGIIVQCNESAAAMVGISAAELIGGRWTEVLPETFHMTCCDSDSRTISRRIREGGETVNVTCLPLINDVQSGFILQLEGHDGTAE